MRNIFYFWLLYQNARKDEEARLPLSQAPVSLSGYILQRSNPALEEEEEEERDLIKDLQRHGRLAVAWDRHGSPVPGWTL